MPADTQDWLRQNAKLAHQMSLYYSARRMDEVSIDGMYYVHAGQAAAKLLRHGVAIGPQLYALMLRAGQGYLESADRDYAAERDLADLDHRRVSIGLEEVFDALARADDASPTDGKSLHPIARARIVLDHLMRSPE